MLTACGLPREAYTQVNVYSEPAVAATPTTASVGTFVDVTVEMVLALDERSPSDQRSTSFSIGVCIRTEEMLSGNGHCVPDEPYTSPSSVQLAPGSAQYRNYTVTLKRGEKRVVTHTFRFTKSDQGTLCLTGVSKGEKSDQGNIGFGGSIEPECVTVLFK